MNVQCSSSASFTGAIARGRETERKTKRKNGRGDLRREEDAVSLAHGRRPDVHDFEESKMGGG